MDPFGNQSGTLTTLFGFVGGTVVSQQYAGTGGVARNISYPDDLGRSVTEVYRVGAYGSPLSLRPGDPIPFGPQLLDFAPPSFSLARNQFGYASIDEFSESGQYVTVEDVSAPSIVFDLPSKAPDAQAASQALAAAFAGVRPSMFSSIFGILDRNLASVPSVRVEAWQSSESLGAPEFVLTYTPDPDTELRLADIFSVPDEEAPFSGQVSGTAEVFAGEDVELLLTAHDDNFSNTFGFSSADLLVRAGAGNDDLNFNLAASAKDAEAINPTRRVELLGEAGNDSLSLRINRGDTAILRGGKGDDDLRVYVDEDLAAGRSDVVSLLEGGDGNDFLGGSIASDLLEGGTGNDNITGALDPFNQFAHSGDTLDGGDGDDLIVDGNGDDLVLAGAGNDRLSINLGNDTLVGGAGIDIYNISVGSFSGSSPGSSGTFGAGKNLIRDNGGYIDVLYGTGIGTPELVRLGGDLAIRFGESTELRIEGFYDAPETWVSRGIDEDGPSEALAGFSFDDARALTLTREIGTARPDIQTFDSPVLYDGAAGDDILTGSEGADDILGGEGNDRLTGAGGDDTLDGAVGADTLIGALGSDKLDGGPGDDDHLFGDEIEARYFPEVSAQVFRLYQAVLDRAPDAAGHLN